MCSVVCFIYNNDFVFCTRGQDTVDANCFAVFLTVSRNLPSSDPLMTIESTPSS